MNRGAAILGVMTLAPGCVGDATVQAPSDGPVLSDGGWIADLVAQPDGFATRMDRDGRDAWVHMHGSQWALASSAFPPDSTGRARATRELAVLHDDLARLAAVAWPMLADEWQTRDPAIAQGPLPILAGVALAASGDADGARKQVAGRTDAQLVEQLLVAQVADGKAPPPPPGPPPANSCLHDSAAVILGNSESPALDCMLGAPLQLDGGDFYDPLVHAALATKWRRDSQDQPLQTAAQDDGAPAALLLGPWWNQAELSAALAQDAVLAMPTGQGPLGITLPDTGTDDDPQAARERVRALDVALDAWSKDLHSTASPDGQALLSDLQLVPQARMRLLLTWARQALAADRPHQATAYLQLAHDLEHAREIGPLNPPSRFVLAAEASLRTGRTREALDHLSVLAPVTPTVGGLNETIGDLAVLEGLGRQGDSKEL